MSLRKFFDIVLVVITIVAVLFIGSYFYYTLTDSGIYTHSSSTYAASYTDPQTGEKVNPFSLNYYENYNNTGKEVIEWTVNGYSDQSRKALYRRGYQLVIDKDGNELYYCDTYGTASFPSMHKYDEKTDSGQYKNQWFIDINDKVYAVRLDGTYDVQERNVNGWKVFGALTFGAIYEFFMPSHWDVYDYIYVPKNYTLEDLLIEFTKCIKGCSLGTGDFELPVVDLGDFIHVYEVDENGDTADKPIGVGGQINSYFAMDVHYDRRGMTYAGQSKYGSVAGDSSYNITGVDFDKNYWKSTVVYNLDESDFDYRYSSIDLGYYYYLSTQTISELKTFENLEIDIVFNISNFKNINVLGFDHYALNGIKVHSLTIKSDVQRDFKLLVGALKDTGIKQIETENVNIVNLTGEEVVVA